MDRGNQRTWESPRVFILDIDSRNQKETHREGKACYLNKKKMMNYLDPQDQTL